MNAPERLPGWVYAAAPILLVLFIIAGGLWMRSAEARARRHREQGSKGPNAGA